MCACVYICVHVFLSHLYHVFLYLFLYHILYFSFRNAYNPECLALYGGPVEPAIAVGGFLSPGQDLHNPPYEKATAIILTLLVNNYHNKAKLLPAMEWEER